MIIVTDILTEPFDEGAKIASRNLIKNLNTIKKGFTLAVNTSTKLPFIDIHLQTNKLLLSYNLYKTIKSQKYSELLYIPASSITLLSIIRARLLGLFTGKKITILALQPRKYCYLSECIIRTISPTQIITQSKKSADYLSSIGLQSATVPLGVNETKYSEFNKAQQTQLRKTYNISPSKTVLLHVGHIQKSRNLDWLIAIKKAHTSTEIIVVGSTFNQDATELYDQLQQSGIRLIREYTPNMEDLYNLADYYIFPVLRNDGAIETPLSVIEAMACNLPIITTQFGSLPDTFTADKDFHYVKSPEEIIKIVQQTRTSSCKNREKISPFTWQEIAKKLIDIVEH